MYAKRSLAEPAGESPAGVKKDLLEAAFHRREARKAVGQDGVSKVRYADDVVFCFKEAQASHIFLQGLKERLGEYHLELNEDKTNLKLLFKWLNRRSRKKSFSWRAFQRRLKQFPLPKPWGGRLVNLDQGVLDYAI